MMDSLSRDGKTSDMSTPVVVELPLRGEWVTPNTPGKRIPSHGTDIFGQRYAYDFVRLGPGPTGNRFYKPSPLHYLILGVRLQDCFGWGQPIFAAAAGTVMEVVDGLPERNPVNVFRDGALRFKNARTFDVERSADLAPLSGNCVLVEGSEGYVLYAHAQTGSVKVARGDKIKVGQHLANVGHSGNSTAPHLHFHLMDHRDPRQARGILCCFREYEALQGNTWQVVQNGIPKHTDRIRSC